MLPYFTEYFGNAGSSTHENGWYASSAVKKARRQIATAINCEESEIIFNSGSTEGINHSIRGIFDLYCKKGTHIIVSKTEHKAVLDTIKSLEKKGAEVSYLDVDSDGLISLEQLQSTIKSTTILIAVMWVNNETGVIQDVSKISELAYQNNIPFLCDGTQALGKIPIDMTKNKIGVMPISSHKIYGPKGVGALYIRRKNPRITLSPLITGGGQEKHLRGGTLNVPGIVGFGKAADVAIRDLASHQINIENIKQLFLQKLNSIGALRNGNTKNCLPNILNIQIPGLKSDQLIKKTRSVHFSLGSACNSESLDPSHVLSAMGITKNQCFSSFRLSFPIFLNQDEALKAVDIICVSVDELLENLN